MIGVFDSGIGGLTVVKALLEEAFTADILYFGDTARTPYGSKSSSTILSYAFENTQFLIDQGAKSIIIACNSASSVATEALKKEFDIPIFEVINPAVKLSLEKSKKNKIGVVGTRATIGSNVYEEKIKKINNDVQVYSKECPLLVPLIEEGWIKKQETKMIVKKYLHPLRIRQIDTLILACTHYPLLKNIIQSKIGKKVFLIDSAFALAKEVKKSIAYSNEHSVNNKTLKIFVSDLTPQFEFLAKKILGSDISYTLKEVK